MNGYQQLLKSTTRITKVTTTLKYIILANNPTNIADNKLIAAGLRDHSFTACVRKMNNVKSKPIIITFLRLLHESDENNILLNSNWYTIYNALTPVEAFNSFKSMLLHALDIHAPFKQVKVKRLPWLDTDVKQHKKNT